MDPINTTPPPLQVTIPPREAMERPAQNFWSAEEPGFADILDTLNPLQHIPLLSNLYQSASGDTPPSVGARLAGGALFGGPLGFLASLFNVIVEQESGRDLTGHVLAALNGDSATGVNAGGEEITHVASTSPFISASRQSAYNAYVSVQRWTSAPA